MLVTQQKTLRRFWYALVQVRELVAGPKPLKLLGEDLVLFLDGNGQPAALQDRCCHRTAKLSRGWCENGNITCGYHGWTYDRDGKLVRIPQQPDIALPSGAKVKSFHCQERYGYAWVALDDPLLPIPEFVEDADPAFRRIFQFYEQWKTSPLRLMENSFDNAHFSYVHRANFGQFGQPRPSKYEIRPTDWGFEAETIVPINNPPQGHRVTGSTEPETVRHLFNRWYVPFVRRFGCNYPSGRKHIIYNCATPIDDGTIQVCQWLYRNDREEDCSEKELIEWDTPIVREDREILEATDYDACIDTRRKMEFHMESDKPGLMMRQMLMKLFAEQGEAEMHR